MSFCYYLIGFHLLLFVFYYLYNMGGFWITIYELCVYFLLNSSAYYYLHEHLSELLYDLIEFDAQSVGASTSGLCRTLPYRFELRPKPDTCVSSSYLVLCEFALLFCLLVLHKAIAWLRHYFRDLTHLY